nr:MAG TPA: hypothetical protein [Bacteriophage sp.]
MKNGDARFSDTTILSINSRIFLYFYVCGYHILLPLLPNLLYRRFQNILQVS